jgi:hypothetical protein
VDALVNWGNPWDLTPAKFKEIAESLPKKKSERAFNTRVLSDGKVSYSIGQAIGGVSGGGKINLFNGELRMDSVTVVFEADKPVSIAFGIWVSSGANARKPSSKELEKLKTELAKVTGDNSPKPFNGESFKGHPPVVGQRWIHRNYKVQLIEVYSYPLSGVGTGSGVFSMRIAPLESK